jgi:hypothetical protein
MNTTETAIDAYAALVAATREHAENVAALKAARIKASRQASDKIAAARHAQELAQVYANGYDAARQEAQEWAENVAREEATYREVAARNKAWDENGWIAEDDH